MLIISQMRPTEDQVAAIQSRSKFLRIIAGPGSGKTTTLTQRLIHQMQDYKLSPRDVTAITFTRKAAQELAQRVQAHVLGVEATKLMRKSSEGEPSDSTPQGKADDMLQKARAVTGRMFIGTIHSWCLRFLRDQGAAMGIRSNFTVLDENDRTDIRRHLTEKYGKANLEDLYWRHKMGINALDYDDLLELAVKIMDEHPELAELNRVRWLFWDEFQDTSELDYKLLRHMNPIACTIVGDPDQAIYEFRGSDDKYMDQFAEDFPDVETVQLTDNFRSCKDIVDTSQKLILNNVGRMALKPCISQQSEGPGVIPFEIVRSEIKHPEGSAAELAIEFLKNANIRHSRGAILCRTNRQAMEVIRAAQEKDFPVESLAVRLDLWSDNGARMLIKLLQFVDNTRFTYALEWLVGEHLFHVKPHNWATMKVEAVKVPLPLWEIAKESDDFSGLRTLVETFEIEDQNRTAGEDLREIETQIDTDQHWLMQGRMTRAGAARSLLEFVEQWCTWRQSENLPCNRRAFLSWSSLREQQDASPNTQAHTVVSTIHGAKGLEWDYVIVLPFQDGRIPHPRASVEEERRLLYVALTRARETAMLLQDLEAKPSRFEAEL